MAKILILEDEEVLGRLYSKYLENAGHNVTWKDSSKEARNEALELKPDVILIDHAIKGESTSGLDLLIDLQKDLPKSKLVMLSNYGHIDLKKQALKAGADDFFIKLNTPPKILVEKIRQLLSK